MKKLFKIDTNRKTLTKKLPKKSVKIIKCKRTGQING